MLPQALRQEVGQFAVRIQGEDVRHELVRADDDQVPAVAVEYVACLLRRLAGDERRLVPGRDPGGEPALLDEAPLELLGVHPLADGRVPGSSFLRLVGAGNLASAHALTEAEQRSHPARSSDDDVRSPWSPAHTSGRGPRDGPG